MKLTWVRLLALACALTTACSALGAEAEGKSAKTEKSDPPAKIEKSEAPHRDGVTLDAETRTRIGLATQPVIATNVPVETVAYGMVLDPSPLALLDTELSGAAAGLAIARSQEERERALFEQNQIVARPSLEAAQLQVQAAETRHETALRRLATEWGEPFVQLDSTNRHAFITKLLRREAILIRAELPAGELLATNPPLARLTVVGADRDRTAAWFCEAPTVDTRTQGRAFLLQAPGPDTALRPGAAVTAFLSQGTPATAGSLVPADAVIRHLGRAWVYVVEAEGHYVRAAVTLDRLTAGGWFTTTALPAGASVVTTGAQILLSEELKAQIAGD